MDDEAVAAVSDYLCWHLSASAHSAIAARTVAFLHEITPASGDVIQPGAGSGLHAKGVESFGRAGKSPTLAGSRRYVADVTLQAMRTLVLCLNLIPDTETLPGTGPT